MKVLFCAAAKPTSPGPQGLGVSECRYRHSTRYIKFPDRDIYTAFAPSDRLNFPVGNYCLRNHGF